AADEDVVADHGRDPFNNFGAPMSARFMQGFVDVYDQANDRALYSAIGAQLPVLILAGEQDPVANYGEGAFQVANRLRETGHDDVRTRVFPGVRHEVHNEPLTRAEAERESLDFATRGTTTQCCRLLRSGSAQGPGDEGGLSDVLDGVVDDRDQAHTTRDRRRPVLVDDLGEIGVGESVRVLGTRVEGGLEVVD